MDPVKIGENEYTEEQLSEIVTQNQELTQKLETFKPVEEMAQQFGISPEQLAKDTRGALGALVQLQEAGIIDENGKPIKSAPQTPVTSTPPVQSKVPPAKQPTDLNIDQIAEQALAKSSRIQQLEKQVSDLNGHLNRLYREKITDTVKSKGYNVTDDDISLALAESQKNGRDFWEALEQRNSNYVSREEAAIKKFAEEHGLDLKALTKLKDAQNKSGEAGSVVEGRKLSVKGGEGTISPSQATIELFKRRGL